MKDENRVEGLVTEVIYANDHNGYKVCEVEQEDGDSVTIVGIMPDLLAGESVMAEGIWKDHATYGRQLEVRRFEKSMPRTREAIERYLGSGAIKGVGPALAKKIVREFGDETLEIMGREPERLAEIKGISMKGAMEIGAQFMEQTYLRDTMIFLQEYGITPVLAMRIYKEFKEKTISEIRTNPYALADRVRGIGFRRADEIAFRMGIPADAPERVRAAIKYVLSENAGEGHIYMPVQELEDRVADLTGVTGMDVENARTELILAGQTVEKDLDKGPAIYLNTFFQAEMRVARQIAALAGNLTAEPEDMDAMLAASAKKLGIELAEQQKTAIREAMSHGVMVITGGPGTGKTTIIRVLLDILESRDEEYLLAAPTGRAAKRMTEATGREAQTIHRLLEINFNPDEGSLQTFNRNEDNPLEADVVIVDEMSMVDVLLMNSLLKALVPGTRLVLVGDVDQLPSVGPGSVLRDLIDSDCVPVVRLDVIFRQSDTSRIVTNAHRILHGEYPIYNTPGTDFFFMRRPDLESAAQALTDSVRNRIPHFLHCSPVDDIQVLTPMKKTPLGVEQLNVRLQAVLNPPSSHKKEIEFRQNVLREGDKVMQIRNDYNIPWKVTNDFGYALEEGQGVFNGDIGRVQRINPASKTVQVRFDDRHEVEYEYAALEELELAYAITIHKAQGTESPVVVLPLLGGSPMLFCRNLLYTGVTRARQMVVIIGDERTVCRMVDNDRPTLRNTSLRQRLQEAFGRTEDIYEALGLVKDDLTTASVKKDRQTGEMPFTQDEIERIPFFDD
ncbi:MAG: ATP-dependent RecD-like DNA helicase [Firmicutes bacterium]|nr:ATP-dependent RecD-like DNA helicase [Bacillota bacterium]